MYMQMPRTEVESKIFANCQLTVQSMTVQLRMYLWKNAIFKK